MKDFLKVYFKVHWKNNYIYLNYIYLIPLFFIITIVPFGMNLANSSPKDPIYIQILTSYILLFFLIIIIPLIGINRSVVEEYLLIKNYNEYKSFRKKARFKYNLLANGISLILFIIIIFLIVLINNIILLFQN